MTVVPHFLYRSYASATSPDSVERFVTSWLLPPSVFFIFRALIGLYAFVVLFTIIGHYDSNHDSEAAAHSFSYFTVLGYWGLAFYYAVAAAHTGSYWLRGRAWLQDWPSGLQWAHSCFYSTVTTFPFVVTIVFWGLLANGALATQFSTWSNISEHAMNSVFALLELVLSRANPSPWINLVVVIVLLALYLALAEITYATQGWYVYDFLNPDWHGRGVVGGACVGILVGTTIIFIIFRYIGLLRKWVTEDVCHMTGKFSNASNRRGGERGDSNYGAQAVSMEVFPNKGMSQEMKRGSGDVLV